MKKTIAVDGMTCNHCVMRVTKLLSEMEGIENVTVDLEKGTAEFDCDNFDEKFISEEIEDIGFEYRGEK